MTVNITSSVPIKLVYGKGVQYSASPQPLYTTDEIFAAQNPILSVARLLPLLSQSSVQMVGSGVIDGTVAGAYPIYAVPANQTLIPTSILFKLSAISGSGLPPAVSVGFTGVFHDLVDSARTTSYVLTGGSIAAAGQGYVVGDTISLNWGAVQPVVIVDAVNGQGGVTAYQISTAGIAALPSTAAISTTSVRTSMFGLGQYGLTPFGGGYGSGFLFDGVWSFLSNPFGGSATPIVSFDDFATTAGHDGADFRYLNGGTVLTAQVDAAATFTTYTLSVLVFGFLTDIQPAATLPISSFGMGHFGLGVFGRG
jgi:hypothetical protein